MKAIFAMILALVLLNTIASADDYPQCVELHKAMIHSASSFGLFHSGKSVDLKKWKAYDACQQKGRHDEQIASERSYSNKPDPIQSILDQHWKKIGTSGAENYYYNSHNISRDAGGTNVAIKTSTLGADGNLVRVAIDVGTFACAPGTPLPRYFFRTSGFLLDVGHDGHAVIAPGGLDPALPGQSIIIEKDSILARVASEICAKNY